MEQMTDKIFIGLFVKNIFSADDASWQIIANAAYEPLIEALAHEDKWVRAGAVALLGDFHPDKAVEHLIACLQDRQPIVVANAIRALGQVRQEASIKLLVPLLQHNNVE